MKFGLKIASVALVAGLAGAGLALAADETAGITRTLLSRTDANGTQEAIIGTAEIAKGATVAKHTHFGTESTYVVQGELELRVDGEPPHRYTAGQAFQVPIGKAHEAVNVGNGPAKLVAVYVVDKGKPLATPAK